MLWRHCLPSLPKESRDDGGKIQDEQLLNSSNDSLLSHDDNSSDQGEGEGQQHSRSPFEPVKQKAVTRVPSPVPQSVLLSECHNTIASLSEEGSGSGGSGHPCGVNALGTPESLAAPPAIITNNDNTTSAATQEDALSGDVDGKDIAYEAQVEDDGKDPFYDVRERMEQLAYLDRAKHLNDNGDAYKQGEALGVDSIPFFAALTTYLGYAVLILIGHIRDICANICGKGRYLHPSGATNSGTSTSLNENGLSSVSYDPTSTKDSSEYAPLLKSWENFYTRRLYHRIQDCFNRPIASNPGATIQMLERVSVDGNKTMQVLGDGRNGDIRDKYVPGAHVNFVPVFDPLVPSVSLSTTSAGEGRVTRECLNLGSYNYLGFADDWAVTCQDAVVGSLDQLQVSCSSSRHEFGTTILHKRVEQIVAEFLQKEDAIVYNMGFNTNATTIPALLNSKQDLILSDELNHTSIVNGARASGANIRTFRHNDACHLEQLIRDAVVTGHPRTRRPWNKIMVIVEGIYSMEGEYCNLRAIAAVCTKYKCYLYLDEAHSIGAMGPTGRGCCEYTGVDTSQVDIMMGTFTKSFGGMGGYIAGDKTVIDFLRKQCAGSLYHNSLSPVVCQQVITSFEVSFARCRVPRLLIAARG
jgi:serine palmitoyltransferase